MVRTLGCPAGHPRSAQAGRICPACRRVYVVDRIAVLETSLSKQDVAASVDAVATHHAAWRSLACDPDALARGGAPRRWSGGWSPS